MNSVDVGLHYEENDWLLTSGKGTSTVVFTGKFFNQSDGRHTSVLSSLIVPSYLV